ncbi:MAG: zf-HC2 domain-containing protein [Rudaea sp.]
MTARIVSLDPSHQRLQDMLPWFVMGTLDDDERVLVEQHVSGCASCRREIVWHEQLRDANLAQPLERDAGRAFAALRERLPGRGVESASWVANLVEWWQSQQTWLRWTLALQPLAIAALAGALLMVSTRAMHVPEGAFHALARSADASARLVVVFSPQATQAEMRRVLLASGARIVDGPTAADAYVLAVAPDRAEQAERQLRTEHSVLLIQSLEAERAH